MKSIRQLNSFIVNNLKQILDILLQNKLAHGF